MVRCSKLCCIRYCRYLFSTKLRVQKDRLRPLQIHKTSRCGQFIEYIVLDPGFPPISSPSCGDRKAVDRNETTYSRSAPDIWSIIRQYTHPKERPERRK
jgi:hypothetical protein